MRKVLFVIPSLEYSGATKQLMLLATGLPRPHFEVRVAVLGQSGPTAQFLRARGVEVHELGWNRLFNLNPFRRLLNLVEAPPPDVIHAWRLPSLRALALTGKQRGSRLIVSSVPRLDKLRAFRHGPDRWLLRRADVVVAAGPAEAEHYRQLRLETGKIVQVPPGVAPALPAAAQNIRGGEVVRWWGGEVVGKKAVGVGEGEPRLRIESLLARPHHPATSPPHHVTGQARLVLCAGPLAPDKGFRDAIWAFEILKLLSDDLHLVLIGGGSDRDRLERFTHSIGATNHVHFAGYQPDVSTLLGHGEVVWVPSRRNGGVNVALEAMAAARPVVASRLPALAEVVAAGETGFLVDPGDKVALARKTRRLLDDPECSRRMGEAGRTRVEGHFAAASLVERFALLYEG